MTDVLFVTLPFFAVCALGYLAVRSGFMAEEAVSHLNLFAFYFAMPALIAGALARQDIFAIVDGRIFLGWLIAGIAIFAIGFFVLPLVRKGAAAGECALAGQASSVGNIGFLGIPLGITAFGDAFIGPLVAALLVDLIVLIPLSLGILERHKNETERASAFDTARSVVFNPFIIAIMTGVILSVSGIGMPVWLDGFASFLGGAASPVALFALGASLATKQAAGSKSSIALLTTLKLAVHPLLIFGILLLLGAPQGAAAITVLIAAMPVAGNVFVIAERYGVFVRPVSAAVLISTVLSVASVSAVLAWALQQQG
ncbi:AEC family transporter [Tepidamorphus sp. 3E244]|uniref:AEC family transporter n=1 Tax=Tepidamorphus sp. 3E244 TaxID=3385498 RepID=UPI0038FC6D59